MLLSFIPDDCTFGADMWDTVQECVKQIVQTHFTAANVSTTPDGGWPQMMDQLKQEAAIVRARAWLGGGSWNMDWVLRSDSRAQRLVIICRQIVVMSMICACEVTQRRVCDCSSPAQWEVYESG